MGFLHFYGVVFAKLCLLPRTMKRIDFLSIQFHILRCIICLLVQLLNCSNFKLFYVGSLAIGEKYFKVLL